jgi:hypothetical protein
VGSTERPETAAEPRTGYLPFEGQRYAQQGDLMLTTGLAGFGAARGRRLVGVAVLAAAVPLAGAGAVAVTHRTSAEPSSAQAAGSSAAQPAGHHSGMQHAAGAARPISAAAAVPAAPLDVTDLALQLQKLYGQHAVLTAELMRSRVRSDPDLAQAANAAVGKNTRDLAAVIQTIAGPEAAKGFSAGWSAHVAQLFNYARGLATDDAALRRRTRATLIAMESKVGRDLEAGTRGALNGKEMSAALVEHVEDLIGQADAYAAEDYTRTYEMQRHAHHHMFELGRKVATGFTKAANRPTSGLNSPRWQLESSLAEALSEHQVLATEAMRARVTDAPDFSAVAQALDGNTKDLAGTIGAVFGDRAGAGFQSLWADHLDAFLAYTDAVHSGDEAAKARARTTLDSFQQKFSTFLAGATKGRLPADTLAAAFAEHDGMLLDQVEAYASKQYPRAHDLAYDAYQQVFGMSGRFAGAIADVAGSRLPRGGAQTGGGGTAGLTESGTHPGTHGR